MTICSSSSGNDRPVESGRFHASLRPFLLGGLGWLLVLCWSHVLLAESVAHTEIHGETMGTWYSIRWVPVDADDPEAAQQAVDARLDEVNALMSTYDPDSELSRFNASMTTDWFDVSAETALVVRRALEVSELSGGAFDATVGPLVRLWSFGSGERTYEPPSDEKLAAALETVGFDRIEVRMDPPAIRKARPDVELDLSGIAKGYGVDEVARLLSERGIVNMFVEIGGEIVVRGKQERRPWRAGIERPETLQHRLHATIELTDEALATSGNYRNFFEKDGVRYSHTIDPQTGRPVTHSLAAVSVIADDCMTADALATALLVLGPDAGPQLADEQQIAALFLIHDGDGLVVRESAAAGGRFVMVAEQAPRRRDAARQTFLLTVLVFGVAMLLLAVGVIFTKRPLRGSCGGAQGLRDEQGRPACEMCSNPAEECEEFRKQAQSSEEP
jgi:FAD:protein FMN transferase